MRWTKGPRQRSLWAVVGLLLLLVVLGAVLPLGAGPKGTFIPIPNDRSEAEPPFGLVYTISLPQEDPPIVPDGPNQAQFVASCRLCHSPRLPLTQPRLTEKKWTEVVKKMTVVYGAPIPPEQASAIVAYLTAVRGRPE